MIAALRAGLTSADGDVRQSSGRLLREFGLDLPMDFDLDDLDEDERVAQYCAWVADPDRSVEALAELADDLWDDDHDVMWCAARVLCQTTHADVPGVPRALVMSGFATKHRREVATRLLGKIRRDNPNLELPVRAALQEGIRGADDSVATTSALAVLESETTYARRQRDLLLKAGLRDPVQIEQLVPHILEGTQYCGPARARG